MLNNGLSLYPYETGKHLEDQWNLLLVRIWEKVALGFFLNNLATSINIQNVQTLTNKLTSRIQFHKKKKGPKFRIYKQRCFGKHPFFSTNIHQVLCCHHFRKKQDIGPAVKGLRAQRQTDLCMRNRGSGEGAGEAVQAWDGGQKELHRQVNCMTLCTFLRLWMKFSGPAQLNRVRLLDIGKR